ncbi:MAG: HAMP domain-containing histidine kinase [Bacteroidia bacterium]|nr:HAMP domain-containing histidine kinase [Bacteroidia bacterium]HQV00066.1 HAMP domain-containing sensor histidine kinase [Bacteroidia bacterium]
MQRTKLIILIVFTYVLLQFSWWAYMLVKLNAALYEQKIELANLNSSIDDAYQTKQNLDASLKLKYWMIAGEGLVFIGLMVFGISKLLNAYNKEMDLAQRQKNFLLSITHEFKSPLAAVRLNMQTMQKHQLDDEKRKMVITSTLLEANRLNTLVENALMAAQIETHNFVQSTTPFNFSKCISTQMQARALVSKKIKTCYTNIEPEVYITGDCISLSSVVFNIVENAEKYTADEARIEVHLYKKHKEAELIIKDNGFGIAPEERDKIFEKFYRIGNEDTRKSKGTGLGLYIVKKLVEIHHGKIAVRENYPQGTVFQINFPLVNAE